jgi:hypothetical protein
MLNTVLIAYLLASAIRPAVRLWLARHPHLRERIQNTTPFAQRVVADCVCDFVLLSIVGWAHAHGLPIPTL